jgi:glycosyltransferase
MIYNKDKVSIITIVYNNVKYVSDCINSVLSQSYENIEYIVIDGGSDDGTVEVVQEQKRGDNFTFISEKDEGLYDALNKGIEMATGDIIGILHSDDIFFDNEVIERITKAFNDSQSDLVYANGIFVDREKPDRIKRIYSSNKFKKWYLNFGWIPLHTSIYVKRDVFEKFGLYSLDYSIASDYDISLRWFLNDRIKKHFLNDYVVKMRLGGKSTTAKLQKRKSTEDLQIIRKYKLWGVVTLCCKIARKIPQYIRPYFKRIPLS